MGQDDGKQAQSLLKEFEAIEDNFRVVQESISNIKSMIESLVLKKDKPKKELKHIGVTDLLDLPEELRKCVIAVMRSGTGTIDKVCERTKRDENLERGYLEALVAMQYLKKVESEVDGQVCYKLGMGKRKSRMSDDIWKILIKDSAEMVAFICKMEVEKAQLKMYDIDEMMQMAPQAEADLNKIKDEIQNYIKALEEIMLKY